MQPFEINPDDYIKKTRELLGPIITSTRGQKENTLKFDWNYIIVEVMACKVLIPVFVALTSTIAARKFFPPKTDNKSIEELKKELKDYIGMQMFMPDEEKKYQLKCMIYDQIRKFGGTEEQAENLLTSILEIVLPNKANNSQ